MAMASVQKSIEVNVPLSTVYNQWTQFEEFPRFMDAVKSVRQLDEKTLEWTASIAGQDETWTAEITEQEPDQRIAWQSTTGNRNAGIVSFDELGTDRTRVTLEMTWQPEGALERAGDVMGFVDRQVQGDLERFKEFIESRGQETGAWRGEIKEGAGVS
jgi:uncharacterized membrane protein